MHRFMQKQIHSYSIFVQQEAQGPQLQRCGQRLNTKTVKQTVKSNIYAHKHTFTPCPTMQKRSKKSINKSTSSVYKMQKNKLKFLLLLIGLNLVMRELK